MDELDRKRDQLGHQPSWIERTTISAIHGAGPVQLVDGRAGLNARPARPSAKLDQSSSADGLARSNTRPAQPSAELERSCYSRPVRKAPLPILYQTRSCFVSIGGTVGTLRFKKPQELFFSNNIRIDRIKRQRLAEHLELPMPYEEFECSSESTSFRKFSFYKIVKTPKPEKDLKGPRTLQRAHLRFYEESSPVVTTVYHLLPRRR
ncbi:hypothetical protein F2Q69_00022644 [Brassica cretica]|uniref:Uncharacterized protein n=1 Tax=Brassica cretica TaxID=69181 RepID=A0A8S9QCJ3_BRACR|nr:hypothetical protein F2Q69_00022644 [Brassica cretica]